MSEPFQIMSLGGPDHGKYRYVDGNAYMVNILLPAAFDEWWSDKDASVPPEPYTETRTYWLRNFPVGETYQQFFVFDDIDATQAFGFLKVMESAKKYEGVS